MAKQNYSSAKGQFVQSKMNEGLSNDKAHKAWSKSDEKSSFEKQQSDNYESNRGSDFDSDLNGNGTNWHTSEDL